MGRLRQLPLLVLAVTACEAGPRRGLAAGAGERTVGNEAVLEGAVLDRFEEDHLRYRARVRRARLDRAGLRVFGEGVEAELRSAAGAVELRLTAPAGEGDLKERRLRVHGGVRVVDAAGRTLQTAALRYDAPADQLESEGAVDIRGENFQSEAAGLAGAPRTGTIELSPPVRARVAGGPLRP